MTLLDILPGQILYPDDADFADAARPWNVAVAQEPVAVVQAGSAEDVLAAVRAAAAAGLTVTAQPGGHGATLAISGSVLIRTRGLDEIAIDGTTARVGAGVKWQELLAQLPDGHIALVGSNTDVSVVGYLLGGGLSWFGRRYGIAASHVTAIELVDGTGEQRRVTDESDPELMWALRGGGGEFGIVTAVELELQPEPHLFGGKLLYPVTESRAVFRAFQQVTQDAPDGLSVWFSMIHFPDLPFLPDPIRGNSFADIDLTWLGRQDEIADVVEVLTSAAPVLQNTLAPMRIDRIGEVAAEPNDPIPFIDWCAMLHSLDDATIEALVDGFDDRSKSPLLTVQVRHLDGALATPDAAAAYGHVPARYSAQGVALVMGPDTVPGIQAAIGTLEQIISEVEVDHSTPNFLADGSLDRVFDEATLQRLRDVKRRVDPNGVIRGNHPLG